MKEIISRHKAGEHLGICSVCSAHPLVIESALRFDLNTDSKVLIEATSNQVNQFGGYTGMEPADFRDFVLNIAREVGFPRERLILGGDHLGPNCWQNEPAEAAMEKSVELIKAYVAAGFTKIHLDASMSCADGVADCPGPAQASTVIRTRLDAMIIFFMATLLPRVRRTSVPARRRNDVSKETFDQWPVGADERPDVIGLVRAKAKIGMKNLAYNMRRLVQLRRLNPCPA